MFQGNSCIPLDWLYHADLPHREFGACLHTDASQQDFDLSPVMQSVHRQILKERLVPVKFEPSLRIIRWIAPLLPWQVVMKQLFDEPPGTLIKVCYNKRDVPVDWGS